MLVFAPIGTSNPLDGDLLDIFEVHAYPIEDALVIPEIADFNKQIADEKFFLNEDPYFSKFGQRSCWMMNKNEDGSVKQGLFAYDDDSGRFWGMLSRNSLDVLQTTYGAVYRTVDRSLTDEQIFTDHGKVNSVID